MSRNRAVIKTWFLVLGTAAAVGRRTLLGRSKNAALTADYQFQCLLRRR